MGSKEFQRAGSGNVCRGSDGTMTGMKVEGSALGYVGFRHGDGGVGGCSYVLNIDIAGLVVLDAPFDLIRERPTVNDVRVRVCRRDGDEGREDQTSC